MWPKCSIHVHTYYKLPVETQLQNFTLSDAPDELEKRQPFGIKPCINPSPRNWNNELVSYCTPAKIFYHMRRKPSTFPEIWGPLINILPPCTVYGYMHICVWVHIYRLYVHVNDRKWRTIQERWEGDGMGGTWCFLWFFPTLIMSDVSVYVMQLCVCLYYVSWNCALCLVTVIAYLYTHFSWGILFLSFPFLFDFVWDFSYTYVYLWCRECGWT